MKIRAHRALLADAMKTVQEIEPTKEAVVNYIMWASFADIADMMKPDTFNPENIEVKPYIYDPRIDWDTYIVTLKGDAVAFTDGPLKEP